MRYLTEDLTRDFYDWERRGRGYLQWPWSVRLEPPFRPFPSHFGSPLPAPRDDGRHPTLLSRVTDWLAGGPDSKPVTTPAVDPFPDSEPELADLGEEIIELAFALPETARIDRDAAEAFFISLNACRQIVGFEIVATAEKVLEQWVTRLSDRAHVLEELRAFFPSAGLAESRHYLLDAWCVTPGNAVVVECALAREFMLPLRTFLRADPDPLLAMLGAMGDLAAGEL